MRELETSRLWLRPLELADAPQTQILFAGAGAHERGLRQSHRLLFDVLKFPVLRVPKAIANAASRRISAKQGMRVIANMERDYVSGRFPSELWEITAQEWKQRKAPPGT